MVESAPQDRKRLAPNAAKPIDPAMKAKKPICGEKWPSRAVAICSGIAMAASVSPAGRGGGGEGRGGGDPGPAVLGRGGGGWAIGRSAPGGGGWRKKIPQS